MCGKGFMVLIGRAFINVCKNISICDRAGVFLRPNLLVQEWAEQKEATGLVFLCRSVLYPSSCAARASCGLITHYSYLSSIPLPLASGHVMYDTLSLFGEHLNSHRQLINMISLCVW